VPRPGKLTGAIVRPTSFVSGRYETWYKTGASSTGLLELNYQSSARNPELLAGGGALTGYTQWAIYYELFKFHWMSIRVTILPRAGDIAGPLRVVIIPMSSYTATTWNPPTALQAASHPLAKQAIVANTGGSSKPVSVYHSCSLRKLYPMRKALEGGNYWHTTSADPVMPIIFKVMVEAVDLAALDHYRDVTLGVTLTMRGVACKRAEKYQTEPSGTQRGVPLPP